MTSLAGGHLLERTREDEFKAAMYAGREAPTQRAVEALCASSVSR